MQSRLWFPPLLRGDSTVSGTTRRQYTQRNEAMKTVYRAILQVGSAHPKYVSISIQSGTLQTIAGQWWVEMPGGYMTKQDYRWCDSEAEAWNMAAISIDAIACGFGDRAQDCRDMANAAKAVLA